MIAEAARPSWQADRDRLATCNLLSALDLVRRGESTATLVDVLKNLVTALERLDDGS